MSGAADKRDGASRVVSFQLGELYAEHGGLVGFTRLDRRLSGTRWLASAIVGWRSRGGVPLSPQDYGAPQMQFARIGADSPSANPRPMTLIALSLLGTF